MKIDVNKIKDGIKTVSVFVVPLVGAKILNERTVQKVLNEVRFLGNVEYSDAFETIMNSAMFASDKRKAASLLKKGMDKNYYKAVIETVESSMFASDKIQTIELINEKF